MVIDDFVEPRTKAKLERDKSGNLYCMSGKEQTLFMNQGGIYDFTCGVEQVEEASHYDRRYRGELQPKDLTMKDCYTQWHDTRFPENLKLLISLGQIEGKRMLLLGNGMSFKEFYFLSLGANLVVTDLSIEAVRSMASMFTSSEINAIGHDRIDFHAVDSLSLPYPDLSFDVVYGYAFVHHIRDLDALFLEVNRCLRTGGICRFLDDGYVPAWQLMKRTVLSPLQAYSHRKSGISPEDLRATMRGGYMQGEIQEIMGKFGFKRMVFERVSFFQHLWIRGITKLFGRNDLLMGKGTPFMTGLDRFVTKKFTFMMNNQFRLVWGFDK